MVYNNQFQTLHSHQESNDSTQQHRDKLLRFNREKVVKEEDVSIQNVNKKNTTQNPNEGTIETSLPIGGYIIIMITFQALH